MGMPITVEITDQLASKDIFEKIFSFFDYVDKKFSTYKETSEIQKINKGLISLSESSSDMKLIFKLAEKTKEESDGYFDIKTRSGIIDPSGIVKGWSVFEASKILSQARFSNFYIDAGGDIQVSGTNASGNKWVIGIKNPFNSAEIVKAVYLSTEGVATSGNYIRGSHIYNPKENMKAIDDIVSLTVIGPNVYEADRFATAAFAMGNRGIHFIEKLHGFEGYLIDNNGLATMTTGFEEFTKKQ